MVFRTRKSDCLDVDAIDVQSPVYTSVINKSGNSWVRSIRSWNPAPSPTEQTGRHAGNTHTVLPFRFPRSFKINKTFTSWPTSRAFPKINSVKTIHRRPSTAKDRSRAFLFGLFILMAISLGLCGVFVPNLIKAQKDHDKTTLGDAVQFTITSKGLLRRELSTTSFKGGMGMCPSTTGCDKPYATRAMTPTITIEAKSYHTEWLTTRTVVAPVMKNNDHQKAFTNCCPTITSYYPKYFHCPSVNSHPSATLQCPYPPRITPTRHGLATVTTTSTFTQPCSAQPTDCRLPNGDFCIPHTTFMQNPVACPTSCPAPPAETVTITHVVLAEPHGEYICVIDAETGQLRDATKDEKYSMAGGRFMYEFDRHLGVPVRGVIRLLGELCWKGIQIGRAHV